MSFPPGSKYFEVVLWPDESDSTTPETTSPPIHPPMLQPDDMTVPRNSNKVIIEGNAKLRSSATRNRLPKPLPADIPHEHGKPHDDSTSRRQPIPKPTKPISTKSSKEKMKGQALFEDGVGQKAHVPCAHCIKNPDGCRVATSDHVKSYNTLKCAKCISQKLKCSFNIDNPGIDYPSDVLAEIRGKEKNKLAGREKALGTHCKKQESSLGKHPRSETPPAPPTPPRRTETLEDLVAASTWKEPPAKGRIGPPPPRNWQATLAKKRRRVF
ncbi:uncharacterized protein GGS22DRAFT_185756 [Annulohypoxylon maeteangense]|uniref:uncharacterized protein n=1 Tax=Annulohypoxylon maeteangense TaxID=1927788 RepID=UPI002008AA84|nr:uncharacterized protein GGS22DRAFT_185756 [Annulohypoxylon maeteangense]KAI0888379.1 hypothetical protein GGS22DRAFT_185756 [Annulohypoxylon maeteangense]